jgi:hypothetical protein
MRRQHAAFEKLQLSMENVAHEEVEVHDLQLGTRDRVTA